MESTHVPIQGMGAMRMTGNDFESASGGKHVKTQLNRANGQGRHFWHEDAFIEIGQARTFCGRKGRVRFGLKCEVRSCWSCPADSREYEAAPWLDIDTWALSVVVAVKGRVGRGD